MLAEKIEPVIALLRRHEAKPVVLVAVDGHSAAGKSTLASAIAATLPNTTIVHVDDFYRVLGEDARAELDAEGGYLRYYDWERLQTQVLEPLSSGQASYYQKYDWTTNQLGTWVEVPATGIILVEGCYAARPELRPYYDLVILVETPAALRLRRQYARADATPAWLIRWQAAEIYYMEHCRPHRYADLVIAGE